VDTIPDEDAMTRWMLRVSIGASLLLCLAHFAYTASNFRIVSLASVQFAELGLPLLFAAFLNGVVWSANASALASRATTHLANALMLLVAAFVARLAPVTPALLVLACATLLTLTGLVAEFERVRAATGNRVATA
jgi:hypothetical protein